jgi:hypothetical protein
MLMLKPVSIKSAVPVILCTLSSMTAVKIGDIQIVEVGMILILMASLAMAGNTKLILALSPNTRVLGQYLLLFIGLAFLLALVSLRQDFFIPGEVSFLKQPFWVSMARIVQLLLIGVAFLIVTDRVSQDAKLLDVVVRTYIWVGTLSCLYAVGCYILVAFLKIDVWGIGGDYDTFGGAYITNPAEGTVRARAFSIEGGSFGLYLAGVIMLTIVHKQLYAKQDWRLYRFALPIQIWGLYLSASKAGVFVLVVLAAIYFLIDKITLKRILVGSVVGSLLILILMNSFVYDQLVGYVSDYENFEEVVLRRADDPNLVLGRVVGIFIVPRMIEANPIFGIGIGNYALVRNDPRYLQGLPTVTDWDISGLGLLGYVAELGIPLTLLLLYITLYAFLYARRSNANTLVVLLGCNQFIIHLLGAQITFLYPWLISAITMGYVAAARRTNDLPPSIPITSVSTQSAKT